MNKTSFLIFTVACFLLSACAVNKPVSHKKEVISFSGNPILPGDFADPCLLVYQDTFYIYATSGAEATVWRSADFVNWKLTKLNWPTSMQLPDIWAPAVRRAGNGKFYLYTTIDHNLYVGVADHPAGPFRNALGGDSIFIRNRLLSPKMHSIDADCFIDDDGKAYLYWGSGFDFKDGVCGAGELNTDMTSFKDTPKLVTPEGYFEGPHMLKHQGLYYLMYSDGLYYDSSYKVRYAMSANPLGPFVQGKNSPVLTSTPDGLISGPGHHYTFFDGENYYIIYHRHTYPLYKGERQVCIDKLNFEEKGAINKVVATQQGVPLTFTKVKAVRDTYHPAAAQTSAPSDTAYTASKAFDDFWGTLWAVKNENKPVSLTLDFATSIAIKSCTPVFEHVMGDYDFTIEYSTDGKQWNAYGEGSNATATEWPVQMKKKVSARFMKITINKCNKDYKRIGLWELQVR